MNSCKYCKGLGFEYTGIDEAPTRPCRYCDGTGREPKEEVEHEALD